MLAVGAGYNQIRKLFSAWHVLPKWLKTPLSIGKQIISLRRAFGMTQTQLAKRAATTQRGIVRLEKEEIDPRLSTLKKVAKGLECELLVRFVPQRGLDQILDERARGKAKKLISMSSGSANIELQKPSKEIIDDEVERLADEIIRTKRSILWDED